MANNGNRSESSPTVEGLQAELEAANSQVEDLNAQLGERDARLGDIGTQLAEANVLISQKDAELATASARIDEQEHSLAESSETLGLATARYRESVASANPNVPGEMIIGDSIADIDASIEKAKALVTKVKASLEEQARATAVPTGAPERTGPDISSLSPREKIQYAIEKEAK